MENKLLSKNYILIVASATLLYTVSFMLGTICPRLVTDNGNTEGMAGVVAAVFTLASFFTRPVWGWLTDKKGRKLICLTGTVLGIVAILLLFFGGNIMILVISRILFGIGYSAFTTAGGTIVCDIVPKDKLQQGLAVYGVTNVLSQAVAPVVALWLYEIGFIWVTVAAAITGIAGLLLSVFIKYNQNDFTDSHTKFRLYHKSALPAAYTIIFFAMATASVNSFIPIMAEQRQLSADKMFFVFSALFLLVSRLANKKRVSIAGNIKVFYVGNLLYFVAFVILAFAKNNIWLLVAASLYGWGAGFIHPTVNTAAIKDCPQPDRGLATGTFMMSQDLGMSAGAFLWGVISDKAGFIAVYIVVSVLVAVMAYVFKKALSPILKNENL